MKIAIMQPYFFPYIAYWQLIQASDLFVLFDDVNFIKRGWINRNCIECDGRKQYIINPVISASQNAIIRDLSFVNDPKQIENMERTLAYAYRSAPFREQMLELVHPVLHNPDSNIVDYLEFQIKHICEYLGIETPITRSSRCRSEAHPRAEDGVIALAKSLSATHYLNPIGGVSLYHSEKFDAEGMTLNFIQTDFDALRRISGCDQMGYSMLDLLAKYSKEMIQEMLRCYTLIEKP